MGVPEVLHVTIRSVQRWGSWLRTSVKRSRVPRLLYGIGNRYLCIWWPFRIVPDARESQVMPLGALVSSDSSLMGVGWVPPAGIPVVSTWEAQMCWQICRFVERERLIAFDGQRKKTHESEDDRNVLMLQ
jgi:hypothetical protein